MRSHVRPPSLERHTASSSVTTYTVLGSDGAGATSAARPAGKARCCHDPRAFTDRLDRPTGRPEEWFLGSLETRVLQTLSKRDPSTVREESAIGTAEVHSCPLPTAGVIF